MPSAARRALVAASLLAAAAAPAPDPTIVGDPSALQRLRGNSGMTVQWISWDKAGRGHVSVTTADGVVHLSGSQQGGTPPGSVALDGDVLDVDSHSFTLVGRLVIDDPADAGRHCTRDGTFTFVAAGHRQYWRMHPYEGCGDVADYVDIYFPDPASPPDGTPER